MTLPRLANAQLVIRPFEAGDADKFARAAGRAYDMGLFYAATGQLLGSAGINLLSPTSYGNIK